MKVKLKLKVPTRILQFNLKAYNILFDFMLQLFACQNTHVLSFFYLVNQNYKFICMVKKRRFSIKMVSNIIIFHYKTS